VQAMTDLEWSVRLHSAKALGQIGQKSSATEVLLEALDDRENLVRREVAVALAKLGAPEATEVLKEFANTSQSDEAAQEIAEAMELLEEES